MNAMILFRRGAGRGRDYYGIKKWLDEQGIKSRRLAKDVELHPTVVSQTIRGLANNRKVLAKLRDLGCPENILSLPADMGIGDAGN